MLSPLRQDRKAGDLHQTLYEHFGDSRVIFLNGPIYGFPDRMDTFNPLYVADSLIALNARDSKSPIWLFINSPGGEVDSGMLLYDVMKTISAPVYTVNRMACSMAAVILCAGEQGYRYVYPNSKTMLHLPSGFLRGDAKDLEIQNREMNKTKELLVSVIQDNGSPHPREKILQDIDRDLWLNAQETIDYGLADVLITKGLI